MSLSRRITRAVREIPGLLRRAAIDAWHDRVLGLSAEAAFWQLLSLPSLFLALIASLGYVSRWIGGDTSQRIEIKVESTLSRAFSDEVVQEVIHPTLHEVLYNGRLDVISIGFILALWAGSSATATFVNTITIAYDMRDLRGPVRSRLLALWLFLGSVLFGVVVLPMLVLGPGLLNDSLPDSWQPTASNIISDAYYPTIVLLLLIGLATLYHLAPPRRLPWRRGLPGAFVAILIFLAGSAGLRTYISFILDHNHAYGNLAAPIAALLFFFILALGVLFGAEFNAAIEQIAPSKPRQPRVLDPRNWRRVGNADAEPADGSGDKEPPDQSDNTFS
ncbi:MAG TPA: YihY/virulence factor BrkB family protein [Jatrophihabitantaceae bacterium]|nr:YihY/virulence factor BrkB family protein [Jatrophihabitantaceae bacterium]